jgi:hypothetical protein
LIAPIEIEKPEEKVFYKYVVDEEWKIDTNAKTALDDAGIENNIIEQSDLHPLSHYEKHDTPTSSSSATDDATASNSSSNTATTNDSNDPAPNAPNSTTDDSDSSLKATVIKDSPVDLSTADPLIQAIGALPGLAIPASIADQEKIFATAPISKSSDTSSSDSQLPIVTNGDASHATSADTAAGVIEIEHVRVALILCFYTCVHLPFCFFAAAYFFQKSIFFLVGGHILTIYLF